MTAQTKARGFNQENLEPITKIEFMRIERMLEKNEANSVVTGSLYQASYGIQMYCIPETKAEERKIFLVSHFIPKEGGGLQLVYKVDKDLYALYQSKEEAK